jgi:hypothetical protein
MGDARSGDNAGKHTDAMPGAYRDLEDAAAPEAGQAFLLEVDGEQFSVHVVDDAATGYTNSSYTWLSGPHPGYGFGMGGRPHPSAEDHPRCVRDFLAMVDPDTGFIGDD